MEEISNNIVTEKSSKNVVVIGVVLVALIAGYFLITVYKSNLDEEKNRNLVLMYEETAFDKKDVNLAMTYLSDNFIQHNPQIPDGKEGFVQGVGGYLLKQNPNLRLTVKRVIVEGDMVVVHKFGKFDNNNLKERGVAIVDIFRVENGKIAEHWDVIQQIPETSANTNTMF